MADTNCGAWTPQTDTPGRSRASTNLLYIETLVDQHARVNTREALADRGGLLSPAEIRRLVVSVRFFIAAPVTGRSIGARFQCYEIQYLALHQ